MVGATPKLAFDMDGRFTKYPLSNDHEDIDYSPENSSDSPRSGSGKIASTSSPKRSKRGVHKRVVSVPIRDVEGSRLKGESAPPSDSWAWRKYGQKPIKGSPYPRGYYRCSSSKGCPARKQVERSRADPTMLVITYSCDHNHPWPASKSNHHQRTTNSPTSVVTAAIAAAAAAEVTSVTVSTTVSNSDDEKPTLFENQLQIDTAEKFSNLGGDCLIDGYDFKWFTDFESTSSTMFESPIMGGDTEDRALVLSMREEDESLFADLGELPECSVVFRRSVAEENRRCNLAPWCGTTGMRQLDQYN